MGRLREAIAEYARAKELNPLSPGLLDAHISALAYSGKIQSAYGALSEAEKSWPGSKQLADARFRLDLRFGDPKAAEEYIRHSVTSGNTDLNLYLPYLRARANPSPGKVEAAIKDYRARFRQDPVNSPAYVSTLATFGRVDEIYEALEDDIAADSVSANLDILFRPYFSKVRADPRFMWFAKRIGLVDVWQRTGHWPDFCADPDLPYNCRVEAAKWRSVKVLSPITGGTTVP
ncbi:tetratricopeptide repeat protein [Sphingomonas sp. HDW15A]|uniref:tetratricopeptide repeat protein n=1 Tax=Sphingomonas sp. HDW15A TaxID=2714942 RepID=UPI00140A1A86|nr:tetratricopeptide repeat protein [Sphingomonas sp. HDW15A]QIK95812.1 tetratricopeptide repeat protein [Sphingomonas sp. HDW15A]